MNFLTGKAIRIAVGVFVTIMITTSVIVTLRYVLDILGNVSRINYSMTTDLGEYDRFDGTSVSGTQIFNMLNKMKNDEKVTINYEGYIVNGKDVNSKEKKENIINSNFMTKVNNSYQKNDAMLNSKFSCEVTKDEYDLVTIKVQKIN